MVLLLALGLVRLSESTANMVTQATSPYFLTPELGMSKDAMRQKMAYALLQQGSSGEPIQAWTQGLARIAQGALGGYELGTLANEDKAREAKVNGSVDTLPGMQPQPQSVPQALASLPAEQPAPQPVQNVQPQRSPVVSALAGPPPSNPGYLNLTGPDKNITGVSVENLPPPPSFNNRFASVGGGQPPADAQQPIPVPTQRIAQALQPSGLPQTQTQSPNLTPADQGAIRELWQSPATRQLAMDRYQKLTTPKDQDLPLVDPRERVAAGIPASDTKPYQRNMATGKISPIDSSPTITMQANTSGETAYSKGKAEDALGLERSADSTMAERQKLEVFKSLNNDFKTGKLAPAQATVGAWADALGIDATKLGVPANAAINGQLIESLSNQMTLGMIGNKAGEGGMPANNFSDADRSFLSKTAPGLARMQGGNQVLAEIKARSLDRQLDKVAMWDDYRSQGKKYEDFERDWRQKVRSSPSLFADVPDMIRGLSQQPAAGGAPSGPALPKPGDMQGGYRFKGGDPSKPESWEKGL